MDARQLLESVIAIECAHVAACERVALGLQPACGERLHRQLAFLYGDIDAGKLRFVPDGVDACLEGFRGARCTRWGMLASHPECARVLVDVDQSDGGEEAHAGAELPGKEGEMCWNGCGAGLVCYELTQTCEAEVTTPGPCSHDWECPERMVCAGIPSALYGDLPADGGRCEPPVDEGCPCFPGGEFGATGCREGLTCTGAPDAGRSGLCVRPPASGPCFGPDQACDFDSYCEPGTKMCRPRKDLGALCDPERFECLDGYRCVESDAGARCSSL